CGLRGSASCERNIPHMCAELGTYSLPQRYRYSDTLRLSGTLADRKRLGSAERHPDGILSTDERPTDVVASCLRDCGYRRLPAVSRGQWTHLVASPMPAKRPIPPDVRAAISAFLNECQNEARPFATTEALG